MRSILDEIVKDLAELRALVDSIGPVNAVLADHHDLLVRQYVVVRRRFDYAAFAVALYASFETFIESLVSAYVSIESCRLRYSDLPKKLTKRHIHRTGEVLSRGRIGEGRYFGLKELDVVKNLFDCLSGTQPYMLNEAAVVAHDQNLRVAEINELFSAVGIENISEHARYADALLNWYWRAQGSDTAPNDVPASIIEQRIFDLVERRNQIAHRGGNPVNLTGAEDMRDAIGFIEAFSRSVFAITVGRYLGGHYGIEGITNIHLAQNEKDGPYRNGAVVIVEWPKQRVFVGQPVFILAETYGARWGRIKSIQINGSAVDEIEPARAATEDVGLGLDFKCPKGARLTALAEDDDVVWSPISTEITVGAP